LQTEEYETTVNQAIDALFEDLRTAIVLRNEAIELRDIAWRWSVRRNSAIIFRAVKPLTGVCPKCRKVGLVARRNWDESAGTR
jgi:hypothetical protein